MNNSLLAVLAMLAMGHQPNDNGDKPIDYEHPLAEGEPIVPCCDKMRRIDLIAHHCICPDKKHHGAVVHSPDCDCPDRFIPMSDMSRPPKIEVVGKLAIEVGGGQYETSAQASGERLKRLGLDNPN